MWKLWQNMSYYQRDDAEYMADEYEMGDVHDDMEEEFHAREMGSDSDIDEYDYMVSDMFCQISLKDICLWLLLSCFVT